MRCTFIHLITAVIVGTAIAQLPGDQELPPCSDPAFMQFDFWVGTWDLTWDDGGRGRNIITKSLDDCVIVEHFDGTPVILLRGMSVSTYNRMIGRWQQTWVDNQGGYLDFTGFFENGTMILQRAAPEHGPDVYQRMVWYDISRDSLHWNWERSDDQGKTWRVLWNITYRRASE